MKIEDPFSPPGDQPDLNKLRRTKQPLPVLGSKPVLHLCLQPGLLLSGKGEGQRQRSLLRRTPPVPAAIWAHRVTALQCPLYWCCRLDERELEPGLEGSELPPGACRARGSGCWPAGLGSPAPRSSLFSSFWLFCCSGHSKCTQ